MRKHSEASRLSWSGLVPSAHNGGITPSCVDSRCLDNIVFAVRLRNCGFLGAVDKKKTTQTKIRGENLVSHDFSVEVSRAERNGIGSDQ